MSYLSFSLVKEGYKVRSDLNISLEFRTTVRNGVLLGISSAKVDAIGLEIVNGRVSPFLSRNETFSPTANRGVKNIFKG